MMRRSWRLRLLPLLVLMAMGGFILIPPLGASAKIAFGGLIGFVQPCNTGYLLTVGTPRPGFYMLMPGSLVFAYRVFVPSAWILGIAAPATVPCVLGKIPMGAGFPIIMAGTSLGP